MLKYLVPQLMTNKPTGEVIIIHKTKMNKSNDR